MTLLGVASPATSSHDDAQQLAEASLTSHRPNLEELPLGRLIARTIAAAGPDLDDRKPLASRSRRRPRPATLARLKAVDGVASELEAIKRRQVIAARRRALRELCRPPKGDSGHSALQRPFPPRAVTRPRRASRPPRTECSSCTRSSDGSGDPPGPAVAEALEGFEEWRRSCITAARRGPARWTATCPSCERPTARIVANGAEVILRCVAGRSQRQIVDAFSAAERRAS
jgi:hypothetical protein